ncbi:hypothetical protein [uncultured Brevundimonas sp.]|uniref:hypothetical protein n=1 Tax=uncultured Brevundimonas sp. TaxID=213418 RepID=UPI0025E5FE54|nr:hypothetical protein [uncultured Brevundimonas sp.]
MKISYTFDVQSPLRVPDHWPIRAFGGTVTLVEKDGLVSGVKITFSGQSVQLAPEVTKLDQGKVKANISFKDGALHKHVEQRLNRALSFVQCFFPIELALGAVKTEFEAEDKAEEACIGLTEFSRRNQIHTTDISFDMFSRAMWASDNGFDASFIASLNIQARNSLSEERYINSFRYSFMAIEAEYGNGQFKSDKLKDALKRSSDFKGVLEKGVEASRSMPSRTRSSSDDIIGSGDLDAVIDHIVDRRGHYFHGNRKKRGAWLPNEQQEAEALAILGVNVLSAIAVEHAAPMFDDGLSKRHYDEAVWSGAQVMLVVIFHYRRRDMPFLDRGTLRMNYPGNKPSPLMALDALKNFIAEFEKGDPRCELVDAKCVDQATGLEVFKIGIPNETVSVVGDPPVFVAR